MTISDFSLSSFIKKLMDFKSLTPSEVITVFEIMSSGYADTAQMASFLTLLSKKGETADEVYGFAKAMRQSSIKIYPNTQEPLLDTCGTGGDNHDTINISTASMIVLASAGIPIAKHGNRSVTSQCGSADVLEAMGIKIDCPPETVSKSIETINAGFMFAPYYHPAMKNIAPVRKSLPFRTVFNILGPLTNPANVKRQVIGVFNPDLIGVMAHSLLKLGSERVIVFSGYVPETGSFMDEISPFAVTHCAELKDGNINKFDIYPQDFGISPVSISDIKGSTAENNASVIYSVFKNNLKNPISNVIKLNSAAGFYICGRCDDIKTGFNIADEIISSGKPLKLIEQWREFR